VIDALPRGWDTVLSRQFEGGAELSGGQWQRIALARAMFAVEAGAKVLVMDEPTANLDVRAEADFFDRFLDISRGLTTIVISHRFSTVRRADEICVLDGGVVAERGTHGELLAAQGRYARMFMLQASLFEDQAADA
jgi:ATP-binding cassette subfamily B protein